MIVASNSSVTSSRPSDAVTVMVADPLFASAITVSCEPSTDTLNTVESSDDAWYVSGSISGSLNTVARSIVMPASGLMRRSPIAVSTTGARFTRTATDAICTALFVASLAVTVTIASPAATPVTVSCEPSMATVAFVSSDDVAM